MRCSEWSPVTPRDQALSNPEPKQNMKTKMIKLITIVSVSVVITASLPRIAIAGGGGKGESKFVTTPQGNLKEVSFDWLLVPQAIEFEGFINYGSPIQSMFPTALDQTTNNVITPNVINQPIFNTRKVATSVSIFDGVPVVLGGLIREDVQKDAGTTDTSGAGNLQKLIKERDQLKQRLLEVEALIEKHAKE